jgi:hypothetical protein
VKACLCAAVEASLEAIWPAAEARGLLGPQRGPKVSPVCSEADCHKVAEEMVIIKRLAGRIADKRIKIRHIRGPLGVQGCRSEHQLIVMKLRWKPRRPLEYGTRRTYVWIEEQVRLRRKTA